VCLSADAWQITAQRWHGRYKGSMRDNRFLKRLRKKTKKGLRGWPLATIAFYGPNLSQATKAAVGIIPSENAEAEEMRAWHVLDGDIREDVSIGQEIENSFSNMAPSQS
jgi:hypothetical protein